VPSLANNTVLRDLALVLFGMGEASLILFFYLFPSGRFAPRWTRWATLVVAAYWLAVVFYPELPSSADTGPLPFLVPLFLLSAAVAQIQRYRRVSTPRERQQTKWVVFGLAVGVLFLAVTLPIFVLVLPESLQNDPVLGASIPFSRWLSCSSRSSSPSPSCAPGCGTSMSSSTKRWSMAH
jgi:hypothetical protein